jgi:hypothetical protein
MATTEELGLVTRFVQAMNDKDIDACERLMADDIEMDSPLGPRQGRGPCGDLLRMMVSMGASPMEAPAIVGDEYIAVNQSPMGPVSIFFRVRDGSIAAVGMKPPGA